MSEKMFNSLEQPKEEPRKPDQIRKGLFSKFKNLIIAGVVGHGSLIAADAISQEKPDFSDNKFNSPEHVVNMEKEEAPKVEIISYQKENGTAFVLFDRKSSVSTYEVDANGKESLIRTETFTAGPAQLPLVDINDGSTYKYKSVDTQGNVLSDITFSQDDIKLAEDNAETMDENPLKEDYLKHRVYRQWVLDDSKEVKNIPFYNELSEKEFNDLRDQVERKDKEILKEKASE